MNESPPRYSPMTTDRMTAGGGSLRAHWIAPGARGTTLKKR
jgi:hypothetical protein